VHQIRAGRTEGDYVERRRRAFGLAVDGRCDDALAELTEGCSEALPEPRDYVADVARVRYLAGDYEEALGALDIVRGAVNEEMTPLAIDCVRRDPRLWRTALPVVVRRGSPVDRGRAAWAVVRARLSSTVS
jgi:hypothetical protein